MAQLRHVKSCGGAILIGAGSTLAVSATAAANEEPQAVEWTTVAAGCENVLAPLELKGAGIREYSVLVFSTDIYAVYLYGPPDVSLAHLQDAKRESAAVIEILHNDLPDTMPDELHDVLEPSLDPREMARVAEAYKELDPSDRVTIDYEPGGGTRLSINGQPLARAESRVLMDSMLDAWLGPDAISESLRRRLKSGNVPRDLVRTRRAVVCGAQAGR